MALDDDLFKRIERAGLMREYLGAGLVRRVVQGVAPAAHLHEQRIQVIFDCSLHDLMNRLGRERCHRRQDNARIL